MKRQLLLVLVSIVSANAAAITSGATAAQLVTSILGSGVTLVGTPTITGGSGQFGTFTDMVSEVGFATGIVLSSGNVSEIIGANAGQSDLSSGVGVAGDGDADLTALAGFTTQDAAILAFSFQFGDGSAGGDLFFNFVFGSDEYLEYVNTTFIDVFGFYVDGVNIAKVGALPITVNAINTTVNPGLYRNNPPGSGNIAVLADGMTTVLVAQALSLGSGVHTMKIAIADTSDSAYDSIVFLQGGSFSDTPTVPDGAVPEPSTILLSGFGLAVLYAARRRNARS